MKFQVSQSWIRVNAFLRNLHYSEHLEHFFRQITSNIKLIKGSKSWAIEES